MEDGELRVIYNGFRTYSYRFIKGLHSPAKPMKRTNYLSAAIVYNQKTKGSIDLIALNGKIRRGRYHWKIPLRKYNPEKETPFASSLKSLAKDFDIIPEDITGAVCLGDYTSESLIGSSGIKVYQFRVDRHVVKLPKTEAFAWVRPADLQFLLAGTYNQSFLDYIKKVTTPQDNYRLKVSKPAKVSETPLVKKRTLLTMDRSEKEMSRAMLILKSIDNPDPSCIPLPESWEDNLETRVFSKQ